MLGNIVRKIREEVNQSKEQLEKALSEVCSEYTEKTGLEIKCLLIKKLFETGKEYPTAYRIITEIEGDSK